MYPVNLNSDILQALKPALILAQGTIKQEIEKRISYLYSTDGGNLLVVLRPEGRELVVVAVVGKNLMASQQEIVAFGRNKGYATLRFHTRNPEHLKKGLSGLNYFHSETIKHFFSANEYVFKVRLTDEFF